ncbi:MAG: hypothetical protein JW983_04845 [Elusimicrobia bacterium]|nr:hypothetical protein [Elusimicrobiota bacterium]
MRKKVLNENAVFGFIQTSLKQRKLPPTVREVASYFNISKSAAHSYLKSLYKKTIIGTRKTQNKKRLVARGIILKSKNFKKDICPF